MQRSSRPPGPKTSCMEAFPVDAAEPEITDSVASSAANSCATVGSSSKGTNGCSEFERIADFGAALAPFSGVSRRSRRSEMEITRLAKSGLAQLYARTVRLCIHDSTPQDMPITGREPQTV